ncbi:MAG: NADH-quinone oxidoreductase subunit J [Blastocatellia bacterium]
MDVNTLLNTIEISHILFLGFAALCVVAAFNVILQHNPIYSALALIIVLCTLAALFVTLYAPFIAAIQVLVYAGAIMVLFIFVIMLLNVREEESKTDQQKYLKYLAVPFFLAMLGEVFAVIKTVGAPPASANPPGTVESIANGMFTNYVLPFEAASVLILMAIVGSMLLARRESAADTNLIEDALNAANRSTPMPAIETVREIEEEVAA